MVVSDLGVKGGGRRISGWAGADHFNGTEARGLF